MIKLKYKMVAIFFLSLLSTKAQEKDIDKANKVFNNYSFVNAQKEYLKLTGEVNNEESEELFKRLGDAYYLNADYENAAKWFKEWYAISEKKEPVYVLKYAQTLKSTNQQALSNSILGVSNDYMSIIESNSGRYTIENVSFNSELSEFAPAFYNNKLVFASNRNKRSTRKSIDKWNNQSLFDLYITDIDSNSINTKVEALNKTLNSKYHESTSVFTKDGKTVYFTRNNYYDGDYKEDSTGINRLKLYKGVLNENDKWQIEELPFNNDEYSIAHPALSPDEKTLYFSSDMKGGKGASDLYKVSIGETGFGTPINLEAINTIGRETFPFVSEENHLYFASDGHLGLGGLDIYVTNLNTKSNKVFNIGTPVNSIQDDFTFIINADTKEGYFSSNRLEGTGKDDIYRIKEIEALKSLCEQDINGLVNDEKLNTLLPGVKIVLLNQEGSQLSEMISDEKGSFKFTSVTCNSNYILKATKPGYLPLEEKINALKSDEATKIQLALKSIESVEQEAKAQIELNSIYFASNKYDIMPSEHEVLNEIVNYLKANETVVLTVNSFTDSRGSNSYNLKLSQLRAKATAKYITSKGISENRISTKGYGELKLKNQCADGIKCSQKEHKINRRSEFVID